MPPITGEMTINDVIRRHPATMAVFNKYRVDSCCGGAQSVATAAAVGGADLPALLRDLNALATAGA
ncbi:MAG: DUF542 domain-containing protein [Nitrospinae bacterium]|nr:DUF542 domain-containing protein [Nitrospinota bacterium]